MAKFKVAKTTTQAGPYGNGTGLEGGLTSLANNQIQPRVKIGAAAEATGSILRQKGSRKFLVTDGATIQDESMVVGNMYMIATVGTTDWAAVGVLGTPAIGAIFTCDVAGAGTGTVFAVKACTLANTANGSLANDTMTITCTQFNAATFRAKRITNKHVWDFNNVKYRVGSTAAAAVTGTIEIVSVARA